MEDETYNDPRYQDWESKRVAALRVRVEALEAAMQEFCDRVDAGEIRSKRTYKKFKALLALTSAGAK